eukprot:8525540-Karenia_brevis.AAC.1
MEAERFSILLRTDLRLATEFCDTWRGLRAEVGDDAGVLRDSANGAGHGSSNIQKDLTRLRERARFQRLDVALRALP